MNAVRHATIAPVAGSEQLLIGVLFQGICTAKRAHPLCRAATSFLRPNANSSLPLRRAMPKFAPFENRQRPRRLRQETTMPLVCTD